MAEYKSGSAISTNVERYQICPKEARHERGRKEKHRDQSNRLHRRSILPRLMSDAVTGYAITICKQVVRLAVPGVSMFYCHWRVILPGLSDSAPFAVAS